MHPAREVLEFLLSYVRRRLTARAHFAGDVRAVALALELGIEQSRKFREIIGRFGRFPHRNQILGRRSTSDEEQFLRGFGDEMGPSGAAKLGF
jgi:uncharacterized protein (DUF924 family)